MERQDFWEIADVYRLEMRIIAKGAELFTGELTKRTDFIRDVEYEPYPMDNLNVLVSFTVNGKHVSLNLENILFERGERFIERVYAEKRVYVWQEEGDSITFLIEGESPKGDPADKVKRELVLTIEDSRILEDEEEFLKYATIVEGVYKSMYNDLSNRTRELLNLPLL